jgi:adenylate cyclase
MTTDHAERKLAAIFAADVEGYSRLMGIDEVGTLRTLTAYRQIIDNLIAQHRERIFNAAGDSVLAEFASVVDAVQCAVEVQRTLAEENSKAFAEQQMRLRIGVHVGDVLVQGENLFGDGVNIAARLESLAEPGGICVSAQVRVTSARSCQSRSWRAANRGSRTSTSQCGFGECSATRWQGLHHGIPVQRHAAGPHRLVCQS